METISLQSIREVGKDITNGAVFLVEVQPGPANKQGSIQWFNVALTANEGSGQRYLHTLVNNRTESIPVQVELWLMEIECLPTWSWDWSNGRYWGQFANKKNRKCADSFSASTSNRFKVVL